MAISENRSEISFANTLAEVTKNIIHIIDIAIKMN